MKVIICGSRGFTNYELVKYHLDHLFSENKPDEIIHGDCEDCADQCAKWYASERGIKCTAVPADWKQHGRAAGPIRNTEMITKHKATHCIGFNSGTRGTTDMLEKARGYGLIVREISLKVSNSIPLT